MIPDTDTKRQIPGLNLDISSQAYILLRNFVQGIGAILVFLLLWEMFPRTGIVDNAFLPPFSEVAAAFVSLLVSGELIRQTAVSLQRAALGFGCAMLVAIPLGLMMGWFRWFERFTDPLVQTLRNVPSLAPPHLYSVSRDR
jgi:NitT/TauT family transport system permease protein